MSINSDCTIFLKINCVQKLPENELPLVSETMEYTSEENRDIETNSNAAVRKLIHILPYLRHTLESRYPLITPGRSFLQQHSISWPPGSRP